MEERSAARREARARAAAGAGGAGLLASRASAEKGKLSYGLSVSGYTTE